MSVPVTALHTLRVLLQCEANLSGLQSDMRNNALTWRAAAVAQSPNVTTLAGWMNSAATEYQKRLGWITTAQADTGNWAKLSSMFALLGGTGTDFSNMVTPLTAVANQLGPAPKTTYAQIISACDQITSAIDAPLSLWPE
jgi:hypothetical protein